MKTIIAGSRGIEDYIARKCMIDIAKRKGLKVFVYEVGL